MFGPDEDHFGMMVWEPQGWGGVIVFFARDLIQMKELNVSKEILSRINTSERARDAKTLWSAASWSESRRLAERQERREGRERKRVRGKESEGRESEGRESGEESERGGERDRVTSTKKGKIQGSHRAMLWRGTHSILLSWQTVEASGKSPGGPGIQPNGNCPEPQAAHVAAYINSPLLSLQELVSSLGR